MKKTLTILMVIILPFALSMPIITQAQFLSSPLPYENTLISVEASIYDIYKNMNIDYSIGSSIDTGEVTTILTAEQRQLLAETYMCFRPLYAKNDPICMKVGHLTRLMPTQAIDISTYLESQVARLIDDGKIYVEDLEALEDFDERLFFIGTGGVGEYIGAAFLAIGENSKLEALEGLDPTGATDHMDPMVYNLLFPETGITQENILSSAMGNIFSIFTGIKDLSNNLGWSFDDVPEDGNLKSSLASGAGTEESEETDGTEDSNDTGDTGETGKTEDSNDTGDTGETGETEDSNDTGGTVETGGTEDSNNSGDTGDPSTTDDKGTDETDNNVTVNDPSTDEPGPITDGPYDVDEDTEIKTYNPRANSFRSVIGRIWAKIARDPWKPPKDSGGGGVRFDCIDEFHCDPPTEEERAFAFWALNTAWGGFFGNYECDPTLMPDPDSGDCSPIGTDTPIDEEEITQAVCERLQGIMMVPVGEGKTPCERLYTGIDLLEAIEIDVCEMQEAICSDSMMEVITPDSLNLIENSESSPLFQIDPKLGLPGFGGIEISPGGYYNPYTYGSLYGMYGGYYSRPFFDMYGDMHSSLHSPFNVLNTYYPVVAAGNVYGQMSFVQVAPLLGIVSIYNQLLSNLFNSQTQLSPVVKVSTSDSFELMSSTPLFDSYFLMMGY